MENKLTDYLQKYNFGKDSRVWNPWRGCRKTSEGCDNCYVRRSFCSEYVPFNHADASAGTVITVSLQSDFFLKEADSLRDFVWQTIKTHPNLIFLIITKRVSRIQRCLPKDWGEGYSNVILCATAENQKRVDERIPILLNIPAKHKWVTCSPLLEEIDLTQYLQKHEIELVETTGEVDCKYKARPTKYEWSKSLSDQCKQYDTRFSQLYLGHNFIMPDGTVKRDWTSWYGSKAADDLDLSYYKPITFQLQDKTITF
jgi:protein gp37